MRWHHCPLSVRNILEGQGTLRLGDQGNGRRQLPWKVSRQAQDRTRDTLLCHRRLQPRERLSFQMVHYWRITILKINLPPYERDQIEGNMLLCFLVLSMANKPLKMLCRTKSWIMQERAVKSRWRAGCCNKLPEKPQEGYCRQELKAKTLCSESCGNVQKDKGKKPEDWENWGWGRWEDQVISSNNRGHESHPMNCEVSL